MHTDCLDLSCIFSSICTSQTWCEYSQSDKGYFTVFKEKEIKGRKIKTPSRYIYQKYRNISETISQDFTAVWCCFTHWYLFDTLQNKTCCISLYIPSVDSTYFIGSEFVSVFKIDVFFFWVGNECCSKLWCIITVLIGYLCSACFSVHCVFQSMYSGMAEVLYMILDSFKFYAAKNALGFLSVFSTTNICEWMMSVNCADGPLWALALSENVW